MKAQADTGSIRFNTEQPNDFYRTLRTRVKTALDDAGKTRYADGLMAAKLVVFGLVVVCSYAVILAQPFESGLPLLPFVLLYGAGSLFLAINVAHDAVHDALTPYKGLNHWLYIASFTLIGIDGNLWKMRHNKAHHVMPNVEGADSAVTRNPMIRLSPHQPLLPHHRIQHLYAPILYSIVVLHSIFRQDILYILNRKRLAGIGRVDYTRRQYVEFVASKTLYFAISLGIPLAVLDFPWWQIVLGYVAMTAIVSLLFVFLLIGTHFCEEAAFPDKDEDGMLPHNWARHAMETSVDWSPHSRVAQFFLGGANAHATHHLFPNICHTHYRTMSHLVEDTAREFGMPYHVLTFGEMVRSHFRFLKRLGQDASEQRAASVHHEHARLF